MDSITLIQIRLRISILDKNNNLVRNRHINIWHGQEGSNQNVT